tara:strand:- start:65 stop:601 length:537 start_codon:yes stop_codon:yes gene_type:complete
MDDFKSMDEEEFLKNLEALRVLPLTKYEALYLSDSVTLLLQHETDNKGRVEIPARGLVSSASVSVPMDLIQRIGLSVLLSTDTENKSGIAEIVVNVSELYLLRECCQSFITHGNEPVGYNLIRKIYKLLLHKELTDRAILDNILSDIEINLDDSPPRVERTEEVQDADTTPNNDRRSD